MTWFIIFIVYILLALIHIGIFYAINLYANYSDEELACIMAAFIFPLIWVILLLKIIIFAPIDLVDWIGEIKWRRKHAKED